MPEKYRPTNSLEGMYFENNFCCRCKKDAAYQEDPCADNSCPIIAAAFAYNIDDPEYPTEWIRDENGQGICTAFEPED